MRVHWTTLPHVFVAHYFFTDTFICDTLFFVLAPHSCKLAQVPIPTGGAKRGCIAAVGQAGGGGRQ